MFSSDDDFQVIGIGQDFRGGGGVGGRDGVAVGVYLHKTGFTDLRQNDSVGTVRDSGQGFEFFVPQQIDGFSVGGAVNPLISLLAPEIGFAIGLKEVLAGGDLQEVLDIPDDPLDPAFLIGSPGVAGMDGKAIMPGKVQELGIEGDLRSSLEDHAFEVVIPMPVGDPSDFLKGSQVAVQEELQGGAGVELEKQIPGVGQKVHESIEDPGGNLPLHPVDLGFFSG
jgi:hypothetical protein